MLIATIKTNALNELESADQVTRKTSRYESGDALGAARLAPPLRRRRRWCATRRELRRRPRREPKDRRLSAPTPTPASSFSLSTTSLKGEKKLLVVIGVDGGGVNGGGAVNTLLARPFGVASSSATRCRHAAVAAAHA